MLGKYYPLKWGYIYKFYFFIPKIHINEKLLSKCDRPLPIMWYYLYHKHCHMKISTQLRNTPFTGTHTISNELLSTYTDCRWEVQKLGCPCFPPSGSKYKPMPKMEPRCGSYTSSFRHKTHTHTHNLRPQQGLATKSMSGCFSKRGKR